MEQPAHIAARQLALELAPRPLLSIALVRNE
jgi:hypothetical protein